MAPPKHDVIVFDIGGTWFRSGIFMSTGELAHVSKREAMNYRNTSTATIRDLQLKLVAYIREETARLRSSLPRQERTGVAISMGAALNGHTGLVLNSGPLWGPACEPFDLAGELARALPDGTSISIVNDVSAALLREVAEQGAQTPARTMLITVSTGIACRIFDAETGTIPIDRTHGIQGEIGHLPIDFRLDDEPLRLRCDCGGENHLNAFCSGRGIERVIGSSWGQGRTFDDFKEGVRTGDASALALLAAVTKPLADVLLVAFTLDPLIERVIVTGGVAHALGERYLGSVLGHLERIGMYQISDRDPRFFKKRLVLGKDDGNSCLIGAALSYS